MRAAPVRGRHCHGQPAARRMHRLCVQVRRTRRTDARCPSVPYPMSCQASLSSGLIRFVVAGSRSSTRTNGELSAAKDSLAILQKYIADAYCFFPLYVSLISRWLHTPAWALCRGVGSCLMRRLHAGALGCGHAQMSALRQHVGAFPFRHPTPPAMLGRFGCKA